MSFIHRILRLSLALFLGTGPMLARAGGFAAVYDLEGNRTRKTAGGVTTHYLVATVNPTGWPQVVEEHTGTNPGTLNRRYTYGADLISQSRWTGSAWETHFFLTDGLGSTRAILNSTGGISDTYTYDAFGNQIASTGTTPNNYRYTGEQWDAELGMYYLRARYMSPAMGRFWSRDTFEGHPTDPLSLHRYLYANGNPVNRVDPSGHLSSGESISVSGIQGLLARQILSTVVRIPGHIAARGTVGYAWIIGGVGGAVQSGYQHFSEAMREEARVRVRARVDEQQRRSGERTLYHYTDSWSKVVSIARDGLIKASEGYTSGNFPFPPGAYGTDIPPWSTDYTQSDLSALFYGGVRTHPMPFFLAFEGPDFSSYNTRPSRTSSCGQPTKKISSRSKS